MPRQPHQLPDTASSADGEKSLSTLKKVLECSALDGVPLADQDLVGLRVGDDLGPPRQALHSRGDLVNAPSSLNARRSIEPIERAVAGSVPEARCEVHGRCLATRSSRPGPGVVVKELAHAHRSTFDHWVNSLSSTDAPSSEAVEFGVIAPIGRPTRRM
jgi:hypothetical protein